MPACLYSLPHLRFTFISSNSLKELWSLHSQNTMAAVLSEQCSGNECSHLTLLHKNTVQRSRMIACQNSWFLLDHWSLVSGFNICQQWEAVPCKMTYLHSYHTTLSISYSRDIISLKTLILVLQYFNILSAYFILELLKFENLM